MYLKWMKLDTSNLVTEQIVSSERMIYYPRRKRAHSHVTPLNFGK